MIELLRSIVGKRLWLHSTRRHKSRLGRKLAPKYSNYLKVAQRSKAGAISTQSEMVSQATQFKNDGWAAFNPKSSQELAKAMWEKILAEEKAGFTVWNAEGRYALGDIYLRFPEVDKLFHSELGDFLRACYGADFKIFFGVCYKSKYDPAGASGSQLWHADGGPGTCINLMWCLSPVSRENGAMECLPWADTLALFESEQSIKQRPGSSKRDVLAGHYETEIGRRFADHIIQPNGDSGLLFSFSNNLVHKGGFPQPGHERYVCVFHIYPSAVPTPFDLYLKNGIGKRASYPVDPAFDDKATSTALAS